MINALRFCGTPPPPSVRTTPLPPHLRRGSSPELRFRQVIGFATAPDQNPDNMDDSKNTVKETGDLMSHSFGEGYATRSDEEGFGGIYGGNRSNDDDTDTDNKKESVILENHPAARTVVSFPFLLSRCPHGKLGLELSIFLLEV